jgi:hypothetical protein
VLLERHELAAFERRETLVYERLCPRQIIVFDLTFGEELVQQGPGRLLDGGQVAGDDQGVEAGFLILP